jgi:hypothetical protein
VREGAARIRGLESDSRGKHAQSRRLEAASKSLGEMLKQQKVELELQQKYAARLRDAVDASLDEGISSLLFPHSRLYRESP